MNLYSMTRGINRFKGLAAALTEIDRQYTSIAGGMGSLRLDGICGLSNGTGCWNKNCLPAKNAGKGISARTCANDWRRPWRSNIGTGGGVRFYPILAGHETESWAHFKQNVLPAFVADSYTSAFENMEAENFRKNLAVV